MRGSWIGAGIFVLCASVAMAQDQGESAEAVEEVEAMEAGTVVEEVLGGIEAYSRLRGHLAIFDDEAEFQDSASWIGIRLSAGDEVRVFAGTEWGVDIQQGEERFTPGASTDDDFLSVDPDANTDDFLGLRLGYVGVEVGELGSLSIGKQKSVHYDIAGYTTDRFNVFGGQGASAYNAGSDGGALGTGRADQVLLYRNSFFEIVKLGLQAQFRGVDNDEFLDGYGASLQVDFGDITLGGAYTRTVFGSDFENRVIGLDDDGQFIIVGARYDSDLFSIAANFTDQENGDGAFVADPTDPEGDALPVAFDAQGVEVYGKLNLDAISLIGGYIYYDPDTRLPGIDDGFEVSYGILGAEYHFNSHGYAYMEGRIDDSTSISGDSQPSVFTIGLHYEFAISGFDDLV